MAEVVVFMIVGAVAVVAAVMMLLSTNAVHAALWLIVNFACVAVLYILLEAPFLAMVQIAVYAGAIMVLFLFVIMLLGAERLPQTQVLPWQKPLAAMLAFILASEATFLLITRARLREPVLQPDAAVNTMDNLRELGQTLFNQYLLPFEVTSILLLVAMIGAIILIRKEKGEQK